MMLSFRWMERHKSEFECCCLFVLESTAFGDIPRGSCVSGHWADVHDDTWGNDLYLARCIVYTVLYCTDF